MLVQVEVALTDGTDLKTFRRGHPVLLRELPSPFGHEFCGIDVATGKRVVAANSAGDRRPRSADRAPERRLRRADRRSRPRSPRSISCPCRRDSRPRSRRWSSRSPAACAASSGRRSAAGNRVAILGAGPIGLMLSACVADAGGRPEVVGGRAERRALVPEFGGRTGDGEGADVVIEAAGTDEAWQRRARARPPGRHRRLLRRPRGRHRAPRRRVPAPLRGADAARRVPPPPAPRPRRARLPRERRLSVAAADHPPRPARGRARAPRRSAARLPQGGRPPLAEERQLGLALAAQHGQVDLDAARARATRRASTACGLNDCAARMPRQAALAGSARMKPR